MYYLSYRDELESLNNDLKSESMTAGGRHRKARHRGKNGPVFNGTPYKQSYPPNHYTTSSFPVSCSNTINQNINIEKNKRKYKKWLSNGKVREMRVCISSLFSS